MVRETNSGVGYHLLTERHSIRGGRGGGGGALWPPTPPPPLPGPRQHPDNNNINNNNNNFGVSNKIRIKSQPEVPYKVVP